MAAAAQRSNSDSQCQRTILGLGLVFLATIGRAPGPKTIPLREKIARLNDTNVGTHCYSTAVYSPGGWRAWLCRAVVVGPGN